MAESTHDTLAYRLAQILVKLNQGEKIDPAELAQEFGVNRRTIQRDLNLRFAYLPLERTNGRYHLDPAYLGKLSTGDIVRFANLAGVRGLLPCMSDAFLRDIFDDRIQNVLLVKGHNYENLAGKESQFRALEQAIVGHRHVAFAYEKREGIGRYECVEPYRLINNKGIWYLAARDREKLKTFVFARISQLNLLNSNFTPLQNIETLLAQEDGIWLGEEQKEIVLKVSGEVAGYFQRRKLIANQKIEKELEDGGLIISAKVGHANQVLPIVRYWIPHIQIISPEGLQAELNSTLREYLRKDRLPTNVICGD